MPSSSPGPFALRLEMLENRMLLSGDIDWLHDAVTIVGTDFTADLLWGKDHTTARLVLHGTDAHTGTIVVDTDHLDMAVKLGGIVVSSFDQVTIEGSASLINAAVADVSHLVISAPLRNNLQTANVASIEFRTTHLPLLVDVQEGDWVQIKAVQFNGANILSEHTRILDLLSDKPGDTVNVNCINVGDNPVVRTTILPENYFTIVGGHVLFYPNGIQNDPVPLHNAIVGAVPFDQAYKALADLLARAGIDSADTILSAFAKVPASLSASRPAESHTSQSNHPFEVVYDLPPANVHLPAVFSTNLLPLEHHDLDLTSDLGGNHAPVVDHHDVSFTLTSPVPDVPLAARMLGSAVAMPSLASTPGWIPATLFEPIRGLRNFVLERITQELTPGERTALIVEPRASKSVAEEDRKLGQ